MSDVSDMGPEAEPHLQRADAFMGEMTSKLTQISLFTGIGGFDLGFGHAGFETEFQCDLFDASELSDADLGEPCEQDHFATRKGKRVELTHAAVAATKRAELTNTGQGLRSILDRWWPEVEKVNDVRSVLSGRRRNPSKSEGRSLPVTAGGLSQARPGDGSVGKSASRSEVDRSEPERKQRRRKARSGDSGGVSVIHFGSPCQDLSVAGKRAGLEGERSGLFFEAMRVVREFRPEFAVWENVEGSISSNNGRDFGVVLDEMAAAGAMDIAWRIFDAQWFGLAQRRRRMFVVADFRGYRAGEILLEPEGVPRDSPTRRKKGQGIAATIRSRSARPGVNTPGRGGEDDDNLVVEPAIWQHASGGGDDLKDTAQTLRADAEHSYQVVIAGAVTPGVHRPRDGDGENLIVTREISGPLGGSGQSGGFRTTDLDNNGAFIIQDVGRMNKNQNGAGVSGDGPSYTLMGDQSQGVYVPDIMPQALSSKYAKRSSGPAGAEVAGFVAPHARVRRLTPRECERLQGFPDDWTLFRPDGSKLSDSARYKMLGNAVPPPFANKIAWRMRFAIERGI